MGIGVDSELYTYTYMFCDDSPIHKRQKHLCRHCGKARAVFRYGGHIKARNDHDLCSRCFRKYRAQFRNASRQAELKAMIADCLPQAL